MRTAMLSTHMRNQGFRVQGSGFRDCGMRNAECGLWSARSSSSAKATARACTPQSAIHIPHSRRWVPHRFSGGGREWAVRWALRIVFCGILLLALTPALQGQPSSPALDAILARIEFNGTETPETLGPDLVKLTEKDLGLLCDMLVESGTGDDTAARMALHALALYVASEGTPGQRNKYIDVLCGFLGADKPVTLKKFLIRQLQLVGDERAIDSLASLLEHEETREPAARALLAIGSNDALRTLFQAIVGSDGALRPAVITAIRQCPDRAMLRLLGRILEPLDCQAEDGLSAAELTELMLAADLPRAAEALRKLTESDSRRAEHLAEPWTSRTKTALWMLDLADLLAGAGHRDLSASAYRDLLSFFDAPEEVHVRCAALSGLANVLEADAVGDAVTALTDENPELRAAAMEIAVTLSGEAVTEAYSRELDGAKPEVRVVILDVLARRGDHAALPAVLVAFDDESKDVRIAAIKAAAAIAGEKVIGPLTACLDGDDEDERHVAEDELVKLRDEAVTSYLADGLAESPPRMKCALLNVLSRRRATDQLDTIKKYARHEDQAVRIAAIDAVGELADDVPTVQRLLLLLGAVEPEDEREAIETALIDVCKRPDSNADHITTVSDDIDQADMPKYCSLLRVLGHLGGQAGYEILLAAARDQHVEVVEAALRGFDSFPDPECDMTAAVLELAADMTETKPHMLGMRAFASLLKRTEANVANKLFLYQAGLESARRVEEKRLLLSGMGDFADTRTLDVLAPYLDDEELRSETGSAMIMAARGTLPRGWPEAHRALERVLATVTEDRVRRHAQDVMKEVERFEGFITDWRVAGPYSVKGKAGHDILDTPFPPEEPGAQNIEWKEQPVNETWDRFWHIDLARSIGGDQRAAYLRTYVWSEHEQQVVLELGSDDGIKAWLNRDAIHTNNALRGCGPAQDKVNATLKQGWNELMLKVTNGGGAWGACARLRAPDGGSVGGVKVDENGQPDSLPRQD